MSTTDKPTWQLAEQICEVPAVDEAIRTFVEDNTGDNAIGVVLAVLEHQAATEAAKATGTAGEPKLPKPIAQIGRFMDESTDVFDGSQMRAYGQACAEAARQPAPVLSDEQISKMARYLSDFSSAQCGVDKDDAWAIYGNDEIELVRAAFAATRSQP